MIWTLARPSFWPEPKDPWSWQRALVTLASAGPVPEPRPCWKEVLHGGLSRRSVPGLYGLRFRPAPPQILGLGLLCQTDAGWELSPPVKDLLILDRDTFQARIAELVVLRSAWVRLSLIELSAGRWTLPRGAAPLRGQRQVRVGEDLIVPDDAFDQLPAPEVLLGDQHISEIQSVETRIEVNALSALHAPLYLLHAMGWLSDSGIPKLPDTLTSTLQLESPAAVLRRITSEEQDAAGFIPIAKVAARLWSSIRGSGRPRDLAAWTDMIFGGAIESGAIEIHDWAPGQPRHGRGLFGDRERKLARWTVHDDFELQGTLDGNHSEVDR